MQQVYLFIGKSIVTVTNIYVGNICPPWSTHNSVSECVIPLQNYILARKVSYRCRVVLNHQSWENSMNLKYFLPETNRHNPWPRSKIWNPSSKGFHPLPRCITRRDTNRENGEILDLFKKRSSLVSLQWQHGPPHGALFPSLHNQAKQGKSKEDSCGPGDLWMGEERPTGVVRANCAVSWRGMRRAGASL